MNPALSLRQRATWCAHLYKAIARSYHGEAEYFLRPLIPPEGIVFDVGAHAGQFCKLFARLVPQGHVYAFEPSPYALSILKPMLSIKRPGNVTLIEAGLSDNESDQILHIPIKKRGSVGFGAAHLGEDTSGRAVKSYPIHLTTLDRIVAERQIPRLDFIKADIEGWELHMLRGGEQSITKYQPSILIEVAESQLARAGVTPQDVFAYFAAKNYVPYFTDEHAGYRLRPVATYEKAGDYLFTPRERSAAVPAA